MNCLIFLNKIIIIIMIALSGLVCASETTKELSKEEKIALSATAIGLGSLVGLNLYARKKAREAREIDTMYYTNIINNNQIAKNNAKSILSQLEETRSQGADNTYEIDYTKLNNFITQNNTDLKRIFQDKRSTSLQSIKNAMLTEINNQDVLNVYFETIRNNIVSDIHRYKRENNDASYKIDEIKEKGFFYSTEKSNQRASFLSVTAMLLNAYVGYNVLFNVLFNLFFNRRRNK